MPPNRDNMTERISVIMVSYKTGPALLEALRATNADPDIAEIILVDNGNPAGERTEIYAELTASGKGRIAQGHGNIGFAKGCNYGAALATGTYLFFLNPDTIVQPGAARRLADVGHTARTPWLAGGLVTHSDGREQRGARRGALTFASAFTSFTPLHKLAGFRSIHREMDTLPTEPIPMPTLSGACIMTNRASFRQVGGFDDGYFLHVEDIALCRTVRQAGGDIIFVPNAVVTHHGSTSDAPRWIVEKHKLKGFIRYFWTAGPGLGPKLSTIVVAPLMTLALSARFIWSAIRRL